MYNQQTLQDMRKAIVAGIRSVHGLVRVKTVNRILIRVVLAKPLSQPNGYAFCSGRNWAIEQKRRRAAAKRLAAKARKREKIEQEKEEARATAEQEFLRLSVQLSMTLSPTQYRHLEIVRMVCFGGMRDADCAPIFPGTNRDLRYQWKRRGVKLLLPFASPTLKAHLKMRDTSK